MIDTDERVQSVSAINKDAFFLSDLVSIVSSALARLSGRESTGFRVEQIHFRRTIGNTERRMLKTSLDGRK